MSKKHFIAIAAVLADLRNQPTSLIERDMLDKTAEALADVFAGFNGQFDRDRFIAACQKLPK